MSVEVKNGLLYVDGIPVYRIPGDQELQPERMLQSQNSLMRQEIDRLNEENRSLREQLARAGHTQVASKSAPDPWGGWKQTTPGLIRNTPDGRDGFSRDDT